MMIESLKFKAGKEVGGPRLEIREPDVVIFVGPNNSGKSLALKEINQFCSNGNGNSPNWKVLHEGSFSKHNEAEIEMILKSLRTDYDGRVQFGSGIPQARPLVSDLRVWMKNPMSYEQFYAPQYSQFRTKLLDGQQRLALTADGQAGRLQQPSSTPLQLIWLDNAKRKRWRDLVFKAFGFYPVINCLNVGHLTISMSKVEPTEDDERSFKEQAIEFHRGASPIAQFSDGVRAFVGILLQVIAGDDELILIDEPEAFLHPNLALMLGRQLTHLLSGKEGGAEAIKRQLFVATHSPSFLMGCILAKASLDIVRFTFEDGEGAARLLGATELVTLMRRPLLRSANALSGIFYQSVIVGEGDSDRAFYQEINERLLISKPEWGIENTLFLNSNGKDTIPDLVKPLRELGIAAAAVVDLDVFKQGGKNWAKFLDACRIPQADRPGFEASRATVHELLKKEDCDYQRNGGINLLSGESKEAAENLLRRLAEYGLFVVGPGEVERWLGGLSIDRGKGSWLRDIFEKLGEDPSASSYIRPAGGDVWEFLGLVKAWTSNPVRRGV